MKKYLFTILFLLVGMPLAKAQSPFDLIYHSIPVSPTIDIVEEIKQIGANLQTTISQSKKIIMAMKTDVSSIRSAITSTFNKIKSGAILDILGNPGQAKSGFCGKDITKVKTKEVAKKVKEVLMVAESDDFVYLTEQRAVREKFFMDNVYAIYAAASIIHQEVENDVKAQIDKAKSCAKGAGSECGFPSTDEGGNNEVIFTYSKTLEALDSVVRLWESVSALKARLVAIKIMRNLKPAVDKSPNDSSEEQAFLNKSESFAKIHNSTLIGFAQINVESVAKNLRNTSIKKVDAATVKRDRDAVQYVSSAVDFVSPSMNEKENILASAQDQMESLREINEIESMVSKAMSTHNLIKDLVQYKNQGEAYSDMKAEWEKSLDKMKQSEQCAIKYLGKYFTNPHKVWSGNLPLDDNINKHELRKGISGWAINAFEVLKSGEATNAITAFSTTKDKTYSSVQENESDYLTDQSALDGKINKKLSMAGNTPEDIAQDTLSDEEVFELGKENSDFKKTLGSEKDNKKIVKEAVGPSKKKDSSEEARKASLLSWQIGAEAAKMLGDTRNDWGSSLTDTKLIWNDTRKFYRKYLELKYNNILQYMKSYSEADILSLVAKKVVGETQNLKNTDYQQQRRDALVGFDAEFNKLVTEHNTQLRNNLKTHDVIANKIQKEIEDLRKKGDALNKSLRDKKDEINAIKDAEREKTFEATSAKYTAEVKFPVGDEEPVTTKVVTIDKDKDTTDIITTASKGITSNQKIKTLEKEVVSLQDKIDDLYDKIAKKEDELNNRLKIRLTNNVPQNVDNMNFEEEILIKIRGADGHGGKLSELQRKTKNDAMSAIRGVLIDSNEADPIEGFDIETTMLGVERAGQTIVNEVHKKAEEIVITKGLDKLYALKDDLFTEASYPAIKEIHDNMIAELKAVAFTFKILTGSAAPLVIIKDLLVMNEFLDGIDTSPETEDFFVGSTPKDRDIKAPFSLKGFDFPPLREVFHFDAVDFKNVKSDQDLKGKSEAWYEVIISETPQSERFVVKDDFLNYGGEIPKIWQVMLKDFPFVETRLPLKEILGEDGRCEDLYFVRSGIFPCVYSKNKKDDDKGFLDINHRNKFVSGAFGEKHQNLNECPLGISYDKGKVVHNFWKAPLKDNREYGDDRYYSDKYGWIPSGNCEYSELGTLFEADSHNNLYIRKIPFKNFNMINAKNEEDDENNKDQRDLSKDAKKNIVKAQYSEYSRNQIGDFLKHFEREKNAKESMDEVKAEYDKSMETIFALFKDNGFTPSKDFFIGREKDYNQAVKVLKDVKNKQLQKVVERLKGINTKDNEPAQEKSKNLNTLVEFMKKDKNSLLRISMGDATKKDFDSRLKSEEASVNAQDKFKKENSAVKNDYSDNEEIYCPMY